jgi:hypothetical protein
LPSIASARGFAQGAVLRLGEMVSGAPFSPRFSRGLAVRAARLGRLSGYIGTMRAILIIDHGSTRDEANHMLACVANLLQHLVGDDVIVRHAHMELCEPSIPRGFADCVDAGATEVIAFPYMLSPGKHVTRDVPRLVKDAAAAFPDVAYRVTDAFGVHEKLAELIALRAGVAVANHLTAAEVCKCWEPDGQVGSCGNACAARAGAPSTTAS